MSRWSYAEMNEAFGLSLEQYIFFGDAEKRTDGLKRFKELFNPTTSFIVGDRGISTQDFLYMDLTKLFWFAHPQTLRLDDFDLTTIATKELDQFIG